MKTIAFLNNKGGVGKTTSVTTIAHILATIYNKRVLVVDLDPQGNASNLFRRTGFSELFQSRIEGRPINVPLNVGDLLVNSQLDIRQVIENTDYKGLDLLPSFPTLSVAEERLKADVKTPQQFRLRNHLQKVEKEYDFCLIDCAPSLSILNVNALTSSDEVYIPTQIDDDSIYGIELTKTELIDEVAQYCPGLKLGGIFFTRFNSRTNASKNAMEMIQKSYSKYLLPIEITDNVIVSDAKNNRLPLLEHDKGRKKAKATLAYMELTDYLMASDKANYLQARETILRAEKAVG